MKTEQEYINDLSEIRSMMERSSKFLTLTGWPGIMAGIYALIGAFIAYRSYYKNDQLVYNTLERQEVPGIVNDIFLLALVVLALAIGTAIYFPYKKALKNRETLWNASSKRLVINMTIPLLTGGILVLIIYTKGLYALMAPLTLVFYGLSLLQGSKYTYEEVKYLGISEIVLGLMATYYLGYALLFWTIGFGVMHIFYGIYMHLKYEK
ncbi:hypothetical protein KIH41_03960 [Litoribacter ruber]|uniref:hypothetical protein n=1 Tax=Litoribacter ruber TaxID=702568 RepID=UPI001BDA5D35|nr:hypothetical protein [Litoribacter ruber]MBT0810430.1 hypothetical protein [Litoribacter ruber]